MRTPPPKHKSPVCAEAIAHCVQDVRQSCTPEGIDAVLTYCEGKAPGKGFADLKRLIASALPFLPQIGFGVVFGAGSGNDGEALRQSGIPIVKQFDLLGRTCTYGQAIEAVGPQNEASGVRDGTARIVVLRNAAYGLSTSTGITKGKADVDARRTQQAKNGGAITTGMPRAVRETGPLAEALFEGWEAYATIIAGGLQTMPGSAMYGSPGTVSNSANPPDPKAVVAFRAEFGVENAELCDGVASALASDPDAFTMAVRGFGDEFSFEHAELRKVLRDGVASALASDPDAFTMAVRGFGGAFSFNNAELRKVLCNSVASALASEPEAFTTAVRTFRDEFSLDHAELRKVLRDGVASALADGAASAASLCSSAKALLTACGSRDDWIALMNDTGVVSRMMKDERWLQLFKDGVAGLSSADKKSFVTLIREQPGVLLKHGTTDIVSALSTSGSAAAAGRMLGGSTRVYKGTGGGSGLMSAFAQREFVASARAPTGNRLVLAAGKRTVTSGFRGVAAQKGGKWRVQVSLRGVRKSVGVYTDEDAAARAYDAAVVQHFGVVAAELNGQLNFPEQTREGVDTRAGGGASASAVPRASKRRRIAEEGDVVADDEEEGAAVPAPAFSRSGRPTGKRTSSGDEGGEGRPTKQRRTKNLGTVTAAYSLKPQDAFHVLDEEWFKRSVAALGQSPREEEEAGPHVAPPEQQLEVLLPAAPSVADEMDDE
jgi:hypothetical protein